MTEAVLNYLPQERTRTRFYGWINLVIAALAMVATLPGRTQGLGLITEPLLKSLQIDAVRFASYNLWATLIGSSFCLVCGPLIDRFGARAVLAVTLVALGATVLAMSRATRPAELLVTLVLSRGFGQSALSVVSLALVGKWFSRRLSSAMGVYALIVGVGFVAAFPIVGFAVIHHNWRAVWGVVGWSLVGLTAVAAIFTRSTPESVGQTVDGSSDDPSAAAPPGESQETGSTLGQALGTAAFWAYSLSASIFGMISSGLMLFNQAVIKEHGFDAKIAIKVITVVTFMGMIANFGGGWLGTRWRVGRLMAAAMFLLAISLLCLPLAHGLFGLYSYAVLIGIAGGVVTVAFFTCWGKVFGRRHLGSIQGVAQGLTVITSSAGPLLLAECVRRTGSSQPLFYMLAPVVALLGIVCLWAREE